MSLQTDWNIWTCCESNSFVFPLKLREFRR